MVGVALPGISIGNRRAVAADYPENRMSAVFFAYEVCWNALLYSAHEWSAGFVYDNA